MWMIYDNSSNLIGFWTHFLFLFQTLGQDFSCCPISIHVFQLLIFAESCLSKPSLLHDKEPELHESARADKLEIGLIKSATSYTYFYCANINFDMGL